MSQFHTICVRYIYAGSRTNLASTNILLLPESEFCQAGPVTNVTLQCDQCVQCDQSDQCDQCDKIPLNTSLHIECLPAGNWIGLTHCDGQGSAGDILMLMSSY